MLSNKPSHRAGFFTAQVLALITFLCAPIFANPTIEPSAATELLPERLGTFRAVKPATSFSSESDNPSDVSEGMSSATRTYTTASGERFVVHLVTTNSESTAYAWLTQARNLLIAKGNKPAANSGLAEFVFPGKILFAKGKIFAEIEGGGILKASSSLQEFANALSATLPNGEGDVPVLAKHLPNWENTVGQATYFVSLRAIKSFINSPLFDSIDFEGSEAVAANYDAGRLVIVEFQTPQLATENDQRITSKLRELIGQTVILPTVYRRVGNYGVFVFNGSSEQAASQLIDQVKYEQVTKWLGDSPYPLLEAQRAYRETTLNMLVSVVKASGLAAVICFSVGGLIGGLLFIRRRAQQRTIEAYSDAGGMLRLNLDEMTPETNAARLLGPGN